MRPDRDQRVRERRDPSWDQEWHGLQHAWRALGVRVPRLRTEASRYLATRIDLVKAKTSRAAEGIVVGGVALVVAVAVLATAAVLMISGIAGGITHALGGNVWAGNLLTGVGVLVLLGAGMAVIISRKRAARLERLQARYAAFDRASAMPPGTEPSPAAHAGPGTNRAAS